MKNDKGRPLDGFSLKPLLADPSAGEWDGPDAALTALYKWGTYYDPAYQSYSLRAKDWRYIRYENEKEELYHTAEDHHEWTNLALDPDYADKLASFRKQLLDIIPESIPEPKSNNEWKNEYFKKHPEADTNKDGTLSWPELQTHKKKAESGKKPGVPDKTGAAEKVRLQTTGTFTKTDDGMTFSPGDSDEKYLVIESLHEQATPHLGKPVKITAITKRGKTEYVQLMVHIVSIKPTK